VIVRAIENLALQRRHNPTLRLSINLSAQTLTDSSVCGLIAASLQSAAVEPEALTFEVTETAAIADMRAAQTFLSTIKHMGCRTALDDFGSGFASFAYLKDLPIDFVKIDGRYIRFLATSAVDQAMVKAMNDVAHAMGLETVAEFVESAESLELLNDYGIDFAQGYHIGRPAAAESFTDDRAQEHGRDVV
jgi:EAL domain-containing protein (putative c-di-GMP-specific phosphodiesterase class I)